MHDPYTDWPDGGGEGAGEKTDNPLEYNTLNIAEIADPMGGGDSVVVVYQDTSDDEFDRIAADDMHSPSEIGEIVWKLNSSFVM